MAMRNRYEWNCQTVNVSNPYDFTPLGYMEVVPGETISGAVEINLQSVPAVRNVQTRTYMDTFAFYVPFRLLWPAWVDYIARDDQGSETLPTVDEAWAGNFETRLTQGTAGMAATTNLAFLRWCYHYVYQKMFARDDAWDPDSPTETAAFSFVQNRPSTFEVATPNAPLTEQTVDTSGSTLGVDAIREAFALDDFRKMREFYGERYVDYLRAVGVSANWSILDAPETVGMKHGDLAFRFVNATDTTSLGSAAGYFNGRHSLGIRKTFIPEHGLMCFYGAMKFDPVFVNPPVMPLLMKSSRSDFWSPEFETHRLKEWSNTFYETANIVEDVVERAKFDEYRKGLNTNGNQQELGTPPTDIFGIVATSISADYSSYTANLFNKANLGGNEALQWTSQFRLTRLSPGRHVARQ